MKKTILYYGGFRLHDKNAAAHRVTANGKILTALGCKMIYLGSSGSKGNLNEVCHIQNCEYGDMYEETVPKSSFEWLKKLRNTKNVDFVFENYPELSEIILYNLPYKTVKCISKWAKKHDIKVFYDCTEWSAETDGNKIKKFIKKIDSKSIINKLCRKLDGIIVISKKMENHYNKNFNIPVLRVPPLVDISDSVWHNEPKKIEGKITFCYAGVIDGNKDYLHYIVNTFYKLQCSYLLLIVIGVTKDQFVKAYPQFEEIIENCEDYIEFKQYLSHEETLQYVLGSDYYIFVRPDNIRNNAGFPTKFVEAYTCGIPIIATNISDIKDYLSEAESGTLIDNCSEESIAHAINAALESGNQMVKTKLRDTFDYHFYINEFKRWLESI